MTGVQSPWRDPAPLARPIRALQWVLVGFGVAMAGFDVARLVLMAGAPSAAETEGGGMPLLSKVAMVGGVVALLNLVVLLVAGVMSLIWVVRTNRNAHAWATGMTISPGWGAGWFFVPIASLWKPFQGVSQTWRASVDPEGWQALEPPLLLRWWWALFLIDNVTGQISGRLEAAAHTVGQSQPAALASLVSDVTGVALALVFARVVKGLTGLQTGRATGSAAAPFDAAQVFGP